MSGDTLALHSPDGDELLGPSCLLVAVDETGHEELADPQYPVFGLGGCLTVVGEYHEQIGRPWRDLKGRHFGSSSTPMHAAGLGATSDQAAAIGDFFRQHTFGRFAAVTTVDTDLGSPLSRFQSTALLMGHLLAEAAAGYRFDRASPSCSNTMSGPSR
jgi:hypothetical protein